MSHVEAIAALLKALPRCCNCQDAIASVLDLHRWPLCERCWKAVPGSDSEKPVADMRKAVSEANSLLRISLAESLREIPRVSAIPPPPSNAPESDTVELSRRNKALRRKIRYMRELRVSAGKRIALFAFIAGILFSCLVQAVIHYL